MQQEANWNTANGTSTSTIDTTDPIRATFTGYISSTYEALILFEACLAGVLKHIERRPRKGELDHLIQSGNVFVFTKDSSGIERWVDGVSWSPSRILGNFLVYRELEELRPSTQFSNRRGHKYAKGALSKAKERNASQRIEIPSTAQTPSLLVEDKALVGSLTGDSYRFKKGGLIKKTITAYVNGISHRLIGYYTSGDVTGRRLSTPIQDDQLRQIVPRLELLHSPSLYFSIGCAAYGDCAPSSPNSFYSYPLPPGYINLEQDPSDSSVIHEPIPRPLDLSASRDHCNGENTEVLVETSSTDVPNIHGGAIYTSQLTLDFATTIPLQSPYSEATEIYIPHVGVWTEYDQSLSHSVVLQDIDDGLAQKIWPQ